MEPGIEIEFTPADKAVIDGYTRQGSWWQEAMEVAGKRLHELHVAMWDDLRALHPELADCEILLDSERQMFVTLGPKKK